MPRARTASICTRSRTARRTSSRAAAGRRRRSPRAKSVTIEYWPLVDGRPGGHYKQATRADGSVLNGAGGPRGVDGSLPPTAGDRRRRRRERRGVRSRRRRARGRCRCQLNRLPRSGAAYASLADLPDWSGLWGHRTPLPDEWRRNPPPLKPEVAAASAAGAPMAIPILLRYCRPLQFTGSSGGFHRSRRVLVHTGPRDDHERDGLASPHLHGWPSAAGAIADPTNTGHLGRPLGGPDARRRDRRHQPGRAVPATRSKVPCRSGPTRASASASS